MGEAELGQHRAVWSGKGGFRGMDFQRWCVEDRVGAKGGDVLDKGGVEVGEGVFVGCGRDSVVGEVGGDGI